MKGVVERPGPEHRLAANFRRGKPRLASSNAEPVTGW